MENEWIEGPPTRPGYYWIYFPSSKEVIFCEAEESSVGHSGLDVYIPGNESRMRNSEVSHHIPIPIGKPQPPEV